MSKRFTVVNIRQLLNRDFRKEVASVTQGNAPPSVKTALLQGKLESLRKNTIFLRDLSAQLKAITQSPELQRPEATEGELWGEMDQLERRIIERRDEKIYLNSIIEQYDDEFEQQMRIIAIKRDVDNELKDRIEAKRSAVQRTRCNSLESSLATVLSDSLKSPRLLASLKMPWQ